MTDDETFEKSHAYLLGMVETLQLIVVSTVTQLPERAMHCLAAEARFHARYCEEQAKKRDRDDLRDYAAAAYNVATTLQEAVEMRIDELADGAVLRTVQPFPIPREDWIDDRGF